MKLINRLLRLDSKPAGNMNGPTRILGLTTMLLPIMGAGPVWQVSMAPAAQPLPQTAAAQSLSSATAEGMR